MVHHEESPEKPQYNVAAPHFYPPPPSSILPYLPFLAKIFRGSVIVPPKSFKPRIPKNCKSCTLTTRPLF